MMVPHPIGLEVDALPQPEGDAEPWRRLRWSLPEGLVQRAVHARWMSASGEHEHELRVVRAEPWLLDERPGAGSVQVRVLLEAAGSGSAESAEWSEWSAAVPASAAPRRLIARPVRAPVTEPRPEGAVGYFRRSFALELAPVTATLTVAVWGVATVFVNGVGVDDEVLFPGWTDYRYRTRVATVDVAAQLVAGENVIAVELADGWYRGRLGAAGDTAIFGATTAVLAQLDLSEDRRIATDAGWRWFDAAHRAASLYDGAVFDARDEPSGWRRPGFDDRNWRTAQVTARDLSTLEPREDVGIRVIGRGAAAPDPAGSGIYDCGVIRSGVARIVGRGRRGDRLVVTHAEILSPDGRLDRSSNRGAACRDENVLDRDGAFRFEPAFTYRGFRYLEVTGPVAVERVEWVEYSSAHRPALQFTSSHPAFEAMHRVSENTVRSNLMSLPTDCPQRDERLGWTGDAQLVAPAALRLFATRGLWAAWTRDLIDTSAAIGAVPPLVPDIVRGRPLPLGPGLDVDMYDRAGWADALVEVPFQVWRTTGDRRLIEEALPAIRAWLRRCLDIRGADGLVRRDFEFGDWLDPTAPPGQPWRAAVPAVFVANAYLVRSLGRTAEIEQALGDESAARALTAHARDVRNSLQVLIPAAAGSPGGCAMILAIDLCPPEDRPAVAARLVQHIRSAGWRMQTGFLTTPLLLEALTAAGHPADALRVALGTAAPSWRFQLDQGATTWWERWDALGADGTIGDASLDGTPEGMISFDHLAMAAVAQWLHERVGGLVVDLMADPSARFQPLVSTATTSGAIRQLTGHGYVGVRWELTPARDLAAVVDIPDGMRMALDLPRTAASELIVDGRAVTDRIAAPVPAGRHEIILTHPAVVPVTPPTM